MAEPNLAPAPDQSIDLEDRPLRFETLGDVVSEFPGVALLRGGGTGASQFLSIRGADFDQTVLLIDDVPLTGPDRGAVDLSLLPLDGFAQVEIFRGSAPIRYGGGSIGGVLRLVPKEVSAPALLARSSAASFGTWQGRAEGEARWGDVSMVAAGGALTAENDFTYLDDNATFADPTDDREVERQNAAVTQGNGFLAASWEDGAHRLALLGLVVDQDRGLPGPATVVSTDSRQRRSRFFGSLGYRLRADGPFPVDAFATVAVGLDRDRVEDPFGRIGLEREDTRDRYLSVDARAGAFVDVLPAWTLGATVFYRHDDIRPNNRFATPSDQPSSRDLLLVAAESLLSTELNSATLSLRTSISAQSTAARLTESRLQGTEVQDIQETTPNYRVAGRIEVGDWALSTQLSSGTELPTTVQLFGNRDTVAANTALNPERSVTFDAGVAYAPTFEFWSLHAEGRVFLLNVRDIIVARRTAQNTIAFENEREGRSVGFEGWAAVEIGGLVTWTSSLTLLDTTFDNSGFDRDQPLRVPLRVFQRLSARPLNAWEAFAEVDHRSGFFTDAANLIEQPSYTAVNSGVRATAERYGLSVAFSVRNVFNELGLDLLAFPRPGRFFELALEWREIL
ncbi:MAG: TonB-dependent receptor [Myxococcota bacterium]